MSWILIPDPKQKAIIRLINAVIVKNWAQDLLDLPKGELSNNNGDLIFLTNI
jgi:hypothetical protein